MKKIFFLFLMVFVINRAFPALIGTLQDALKPDMIQVFDDKFLLVEGAKFSIYSLEDMKLITKFGREGEGPGELKVVPYWQNRVTVYDDYILAEGVDKLIYYSKKGDLLKEKRKSYTMAQMVPIGENFLCKINDTNNAEKITYITVCLYNSELKLIKELHREKFGHQRNVRQMIIDHLNYQVYDDKIFIEESPKGFFFEVFDKTGQKLYQIEKDYEKIEVTEDKKNEAIEKFKANPQDNLRIKSEGGWENYKKLFTIQFPDYMPAIRDFSISNNKIYTRTSKVSDGKEEYIIMDLKGNIIKKLFIPPIQEALFMGKVLGVKLDVIVNDKLYFIKENEKSELWELHVEEIK